MKSAAKPKKFPFVPELVPAPLFGRSAYRMLEKRKAWKIIRQDALGKAGQCCEACGTTQGQLSCHEKWDYDDTEATATLVGFEISCQLCHMISHAGRSISHGFKSELIAHLCKMNECTEAEALGIIDAAMAQWRERSKRKWTIRISPAMRKLYPDLGRLPNFVPKEETQR
jgi:hypothetical protein